MDVDVIGQMLEDKGMTHSEIDEWFAHAGVKGMKWGVRRFNRIQKNVDRIARVRDGTATKTDRVLAFNNNLTVTKKQAAKQLERSAKMQEKVAAGKSFTGKFMLKYEKRLYSELNFHQEGG